LNCENGVCVLAEQSEKYRKLLGDLHVGHQYYSDAESWTGPFWSEAGPFRPMFEQLDLTNTIELACGHGRHTAQILGRFGTMSLVDINRSNIDVCRQRFAGRTDISYFVTTGNELRGIASGEYTSLFCYDAMVHFESFDVIAYLRETMRVLKPGAMALLHYSNFDQDPESSFNTNIHWRNYFSEKMMRHFSTRMSFEVVESKIIDWPTDGGEKGLDAITLLRKPLAEFR
jgi:ubiquinone/menaquinone biosynthesis C-methylase UbiE